MVKSPPPLAFRHSLTRLHTFCYKELKGREEVNESDEKWYSADNKVKIIILAVPSVFMAFILMFTSIHHEAGEDEVTFNAQAKATNVISPYLDLAAEGCEIRLPTGELINHHFLGPDYKKEEMIIMEAGTTINGACFPTVIN